MLHKIGIRCRLLCYDLTLVTLLSFFSRYAVGDLGDNIKQLSDQYCQFVHSQELSKGLR